MRQGRAETCHKPFRRLTSATGGVTHCHFQSRDERRLKAALVESGGGGPMIEDDKKKR
jgi:hypothetical protein